MGNHKDRRVGVGERMQVVVKRDRGHARRGTQHGSSR